LTAKALIRGGVLLRGKRFLSLKIATRWSRLIFMILILMRIGPDLKE